MKWFNPNPGVARDESNRAQEEARILNNPFNQLQDPSWRRWFDTLKAQGVDKLAAGPSFNEPYQPTFDPSRGQSSAVASAAPLVDKQGAVSGYKIQGRSQKPTMANPSSIDGILRASKRR